jgi:hypothetical protein
MHLRRFMLYTARSVLPKGQQVEATRYLLEYNCWPPPFFIVLISLIQLVSSLNPISIKKNKFTGYVHPPTI